MSSSSLSPNSLLDELAAADAQGERALYSLWPGDAFLYRKDFHTITSMQLVEPRRLSLKTDTGHHFLFDGYLVMPALLSEEHLEAERADHQIW